MTFENKELNLAEPYLTRKPKHAAFIQGHSKRLGETFLLSIKLLIILPFALLSILLTIISLVGISKVNSNQSDLFFGMNQQIAWGLIAIAMIASTGLTWGAITQIVRRISTVRMLEKTGVLIAGKVTNLIRSKKSGQSTEHDYQIQFYTPEHIELRTIVRLRDMSQADINDMIGIQAAVLYTSPSLYEVL